MQKNQEMTRQQRVVSQLKVKSHSGAHFSTLLHFISVEITKILILQAIWVISTTSQQSLQNVSVHCSIVLQQPIFRQSADNQIVLHCAQYCSWACFSSPFLLIESRMQFFSRLFYKMQCFVQVFTGGEILLWFLYIVNVTLPPS